MTILLFGKTYDTNTQNLNEIEKSVQNNLDTYLFGKSGMVTVKIESSANSITYTLRRSYKDLKDTDYIGRNVLLEDCQFFTGHGCLGFKLPCSWGGIPYLGVMPMIVFLEEKHIEKVYKDSCKVLGIDVPKSVSLKSEKNTFQAILNYPKYKNKSKAKGTVIKAESITSSKLTT